MAEIFVFNSTEFKELYPQFDKYTDAQLRWAFDQVEGFILDNSSSACISLKRRRVLFYLLVAHMMELQGRIDSGNSSLIGRVSSATEGSVSISSSFPESRGAIAAWLNQTPFGVQYRAFAAQYMSLLWVAAEQPMPVNRNRWNRPRSY